MAASTSPARAAKKVLDKVKQLSTGSPDKADNCARGSLLQGEDINSRKVPASSGTGKNSEAAEKNHRTAAADKSPKSGRRSAGIEDMLGNPDEGDDARELMPNADEDQDSSEEEEKEEKSSSDEDDEDDDENDDEEKEAPAESNKRTPSRNRKNSFNETGAGRLSNDGRGPGNSSPMSSPANGKNAKRPKRG